MSPAASQASSPVRSGARSGRGWLEFAGCRGVDPEVFFPSAESGGELHDEQVAAAKAVCAACPVRKECLEFALEVLSDGIAAGLDECERRALRRARRGSAAADAAAVAAADAVADAASTADANGVAPGELDLSGPAAVAREGRAAGRSVPSLAAELGVSTRTVERWTRTGAA